MILLALMILGLVLVLIFKPRRHASGEGTHTGTSTDYRRLIAACHSCGPWRDAPITVMGDAMIGVMLLHSAAEMVEQRIYIPDGNNNTRGWFCGIVPNALA